MSSNALSADESLARLARANEESFFTQLKTLEDFLASHDHTLESAIQLLYSNKHNDPAIEAKAQEISRRIRELYQFRDFLTSQHDPSQAQIQTNLAPLRLRRLARV
jgi:flagellar basal body-associated protein FliL